MSHPSIEDLANLDFNMTVIPIKRSLLHTQQRHKHPTFVKMGQAVTQRLPSIKPTATYFRKPQIYQFHDMDGPSSVLAGWPTPHYLNLRKGHHH